MQPGALAPYEQALSGRLPLQVLAVGGDAVALDVNRWLAPADVVDRAIISACCGPVLDVGCGPGRLLHELERQGKHGLGIDIAPTAITLARERGAAAIHADVFGPVPDEGGWSSVLLIDGNIGIGGDPAALLTRVRTLLRPGGVAYVETDPDDDADACRPMRFVRSGHAIGPEFPWAIVGGHALRRHARRAGLRVQHAWHRDGRAFASLTSP